MAQRKHTSDRVFFSWKMRVRWIIFDNEDSHGGHFFVGFPLKLTAADGVALIQFRLKS